MRSTTSWAGCPLRSGSGARATRQWRRSTSWRSAGRWRRSRTWAAVAGGRRRATAARSCASSPRTGSTTRSTSSGPRTARWSTAAGAAPSDPRRTPAARASRRSRRITGRRSSRTRIPSRATCTSGCTRWRGCTAPSAWARTGCPGCTTRTCRRADRRRSPRSGSHTAPTTTAAHGRGGPGTGTG